MFPSFISIKKDHPYLLQLYLETKSGVGEFCTIHLEYLTIEKLRSYICIDFSKELDSGETKLGYDDTSEG